MPDDTIQLPAPSQATPAPQADTPTSESPAAREAPHIGDEDETKAENGSGKTSAADAADAVKDRVQRRTEFFESLITIETVKGRPMMKVASPVTRGYHGYFWVPTALTAEELSAFFQNVEECERTDDSLDNAWMRRKPFVAVWGIYGLDLNAPPEDVPILFKMLFSHVTNGPLIEAVFPGN